MSHTDERLNKSEGKRFICPECDNDVWNSEGTAVLFRLWPANGRVAIAEQLSEQPPTDLDVILCNGCDFRFRWSERAPELFLEQPLSELEPFQIEDAIYEIRSIQQRVSLLAELLDGSSGPVRGHVQRAAKALDAAERRVTKELDDL